MNVFDSIDFRVSPYKGIITEVAKERGVSNSAIRQAMQRGNPKVVAAVSAKIKAIRATLREASEVVANETAGADA